MYSNAFPSDSTFFFFDMLGFSALVEAEGDDGAAQSSEFQIRP